MSKRLLLLWPILVLCLSQVSSLAQVTDPLGDEMNQRNEALIHDGFSMTNRILLRPGSEKATIRRELYVPESRSEHTFRFWAESKAGELAVRLLGPDGKTVASWSGRKGELTVSLAAPSGQYVLEIDRSPEVNGGAVFGVKGGAIGKCEPGNGSMQEHAADPAKGFQWPYLLFIPKEVKSAHLLVVPNNTGFSTADLELLRASASCEVVSQAAIATRLGTPLLIPLFPRPLEPGETDNLYLHALTRASLETNLPRFHRTDLQLLAMIDDARTALRENHIDTGPKVYLRGFSASGSFVNRFTILHPENVAAVASGAPGGWPIAPVDEFEGERLPYPVGIADIKTLTGHPLNLPQLKQVPWLFSLGDQDENDSVPFRDSFSKSAEELIVRRFGKTPISRWKTAEELYKKAGLNARFVLYPGISHTVSPEMEKDIALFFEEAEGKSGGAHKPMRDR